MSRCTIHPRLNLWATEELYVLEPQASEAALVINRRNGHLSLQPFDPRLTRVTTPILVHGLMGIITLATSDFLILITDSKHCGNIQGKQIFQATDYKVLPVVSYLTTAELLNHPVEKQLLSLVHSHLFASTFYFSYDWDVTRRSQAQWVAVEDDVDKAPWQSADSRFFWNWHLSLKFMHSGLDLGRFILPVLYGTIDIRNATLNGRNLNLILISRRSRFRAGTRYFARGIDSEGHVANYNETEQIVITEEGAKTVFVQTRGSIPVFWAEVNNLRYKPDMVVMEKPESVPALRLHLQEQIALYGSQTLVNLVRSKGHEAPVKEAYETNLKLAAVPSVQYHYFNFHSECSNMQWDRINGLVDMVEQELKEKGFFSVSSDGKVVKAQLGVVRTNCMDNLDRTNVVQSTFAKYSLTKQLQSLGVLSSGDSIENHEDFMLIFRDMWTDHGNLISTAYSGTGALKADFTRTGKRTRYGLLQDGMNGMIRYIKNNYFDGPRQDAFDLFTGNWVARGPSSALGLFHDPRPLVARSMPYLFSFAVFMILAGLTLPRSSDYSLKYYFIFWFLLALATFVYIRLHGIDYVSWPRLKPLDEVIYWSGPGFRSNKAPKSPGSQNYQQPYKGRVPARPYRATEEIEMGVKKRLE